MSAALVTAVSRTIEGEERISVLCPDINVPGIGLIHVVSGHDVSFSYYNFVGQLLQECDPNCVTN